MFRHRLNSQNCFTGWWIFRRGLRTAVIAGFEPLTLTMNWTTLSGSVAVISPQTTWLHLHCTAAKFARRLMNLDPAEACTTPWIPSAIFALPPSAARTKWNTTTEGRWNCQKGSRGATVPCRLFRLCKTANHHSSLATSGNHLCSLQSYKCG